jgi:3-hydroxyisobutyrate dehydrogenase/2-hydroxy-3-oxopropionate reductase
MARRVLEAGHDVAVWNRSPERAAALVAAGAGAASTPAAVAAGAEAVITMVSDPAALCAVSEGSDGVAAGVRPRATVIEMSTVGPAAVRRLRSVLPAPTALVDAPVLGSVAEAEAGALAILAGGDASDVARVEPVMSALGRVLHVGPLGAGAAAKLVANMSLFAVVAALGEALTLADGLGLSRATTFGVLARTPLADQAKRRHDSFEQGHYPRRFALALARKDADLVVEAAARAGLDLRVAAAAASWLLDAERAGLGERDHSAVLAQIAGGA